MLDPKGLGGIKVQALMLIDTDAKTDLVAGNTRHSHRQKNLTVAASVLAKTTEPSRLALSAGIEGDARDEKRVLR